MSGLQKYVCPLVITKLIETSTENTIWAAVRKCYEPLRYIYNTEIC